MQDIVRANGHRLVAGNRPFYFAGANNYSLVCFAADEGQRPQVAEVLDDAQRLKLTVLRVWAFCDGREEWNAVQTAPGEFNEHVLRGLDWLLVEAGRRGIRLLLALTNFWPDYGGMAAYVRWRYGIADKASHDMEQHPTRLFYADPQCQAAFRRAMQAVVGRTNTLSGVLYTQDPAILAWELANEPRCDGEGGAAVLQEWIASTAIFLRGLDPNHLVTVGLEGFYGPSTPGLLQHNPYDSAAAHGADFAAIFSHPALDFATIHLYPDQWLPSPRDASHEQIKSWMRNWLQSHAALCAGQLHKPLVLSEFGKRDPGSYQGEECARNMGRTEAFKEVLDCAMELAAGGGPLAGVCAWMLAAREYPAEGRCGGGSQAQPAVLPDDEPAVDALCQYGAVMAALVSAADP
ncbi:Mannan endo-1,4-beta-mannosidase 8, partial [Tetrabaena socialis]